MVRLKFLIFISSLWLAMSIYGQKKNYEKEWLAIEELEIDGKVASAFEKTTDLLKKATSAKNDEQILKCLLFKWKFQQIIDEKSQVKILEEVVEEIEKQVFPNKQLLEMYLAHFLQTHLNSNFWQIKNRTSTENAALKDYRTWDVNTFLKQITLHYENALKPSVNLAGVSNDQISELLIEAPETRKFKPTIYDIIAYKALDFYSNSRNRIHKPKDEFLIDNAAFFSNSSTFIQKEIVTTDTESLLFKALKTYQDLEKIHSQQKSEEALVFNIKNRLAFVKKNHSGTNTNELYLESLQNLDNQFKNKPIVQIELAKAYRNLAFQKDKDGLYKYPNYNQKALALCEEIGTSKSDKIATAEAENLKAQILQSRIDWTTHNKYLPNKPHLAKIAFTNAKSFQLKAYEVDFDFNQNEFNYQDRDSLTAQYLENKKVLFTEKYTLPTKNDYNSYSTEVIVPKLPIGTYFFEITSADNRKKYNKITVTELSLNKTDNHDQNTYQVLDRYTGKPITDAQIEIRKRNHRRNQQEFSTKKLSTDASGFFSYPKTNSYENIEIIITKDADTILVSDNNYSRNKTTNYTQDNNAYKSKTLVFLDRAIYRPSQKVYFKALAIAEENQVSSIIADTNIKILVKNANREKVYETTLKTNEFGSVHGNFDLPESGLNGNYFITAELETVKNKRKHSNANISFSVEEYKRPTFEVTFDKLTKVYKPLDSIKVTGNAKAFLGTNITNAEVTYSVKRNTQHRFWWYFRPQSNESKQIALGNTVTDDQGNFTIPFKAETDNKNTKDNIYNYTIEVKVTDLNGETREATTNIKVADKNLLANVSTEENWRSEIENEIKINTTDANNNPIVTNGQIKIYKLESPGRFLKERPWPVPDIQNINQETFIKNFPHIPFTNENKKENWKKGTLVFEENFNKVSETTKSLKNTKKWTQGAYAIVIEVMDPKTNTSTKTEKFINLQHKSQDFPADEKLFVHEVDYDEKNPTKAAIKLQTSAPELMVFAEAFNGDVSIWKEEITLKKGSVSKNINFPKLKYPKVTFQFYYQIFNEFYHHTKELDFTEKPMVLNIEKKHFTDKISPSTKETWSFVVKTSNNSAFNAEALASMYDASLDQFRKSTWGNNFAFTKNYPSPPFTRALTRLRTSNINYHSEIKNKVIPRMEFEKLNLFGFEFNQVNSWSYLQYLTKLKYQNQYANLDLKDKGKKVTIYGQVWLEGMKTPASGVNILIPGSDIGTVSDFDGNFSINTKIGGVLQFQYLGFKTQEVIIKNEEKLNIHLEDDTESLDKLVVVGYGEKKSGRRNKSAVASSMAMEAQMSDESAAPMNSKITIRGTSSIEKGKHPLIVIDGKIIGNDEGIINQIGVNNIQEIKVLKDANSIATYGSRAINGVILVTTKTGFTYVPEESIDNLKNIKARTNLQETAFFLPNLKTNSKGEIEFEFDTPEALTRWNFRLLTHTKNGIAGKLNAKTLTQKELNIIPNAPRFVREGDTLRFSSKIANLTDKTLGGTALLEFMDPTTGNSINTELLHTNTTQNFSIDANGNTSINWKIAIPEGLSTLQYKVVAKAGNFSDGEEKIIPVLSNRMLVTESIPMWVRAGETETYSLENFDLNNKTQKPFGITLEYTSNPAWLAIKSLPYLMEFPHECSEQTFSRLYANSIATHILNSQPKIKDVFESWAAKGTLQSPLETNEELKNILISESPWLQEAASETEQQQRLGELFDLAKASAAKEKALNKLRQLQNANGGFPWFKGGKANPFITRHILAGFGHLEKLKITSQRTKNDHMIKSMIQFLDNKLLEDYKEYLKHSKNPENFYKKVSLLHYAYARSFYVNRSPVKGQSKEILDKALAFQKENWQQRSIYEKGLLALCLHRFEKSPVAQKILTALTESVVQSKANGLYWKENKNSWWWHSSEISTQALLIEAFSELEQPKKYIESLKLYLLKNKRTNRWESTIQTADACYALLLQGNDWLSIKDNTTIKVGNEKIATKKLSETEKEQGTGYLKTRWKAEEITKNFKEITVTNKSDITGYGGYYWQYFEHLDKIKTDDHNPMTIQKELYKKVTTDKGTTLKVITESTPLKIGDKVTVRLLIKSDDNLEFVHLKDMRVAGFEPVDVISSYQYKERLRYYQSTKDVATHFFIDYLPKGNYVLEYDVIANQNGSFSNGITQLQCMYAPEFSSHSAGQRVEVLE